MVTEPRAQHCLGSVSIDARLKAEQRAGSQGRCAAAGITNDLTGVVQVWRRKHWANCPTIPFCPVYSGNVILPCLQWQCDSALFTVAM